MKNTKAFSIAGAMVTAGLAISLGAAFSSCSSGNYSFEMSRRMAQTEKK